MKEAYYFSHDSNAHNDPKILSMICDYGMNGYGRFWILIENLREQSDFRLKHDKGSWKALAMQMQCTPDEVKKYIEDCVYEYALLEMSEDLYFSSNSLNRRMGRYLDSKQKKIDAANKRWNNAKDMQRISSTDTSNIQNDANEIKLNEIKLKEIKDIYITAQHLSLSKGEYTKLVDLYGKDFVDNKIEYARNYKNLKKYVSLYLTLNNWLKADLNAQKKAVNDSLYPDINPDNY